MATIEELEARIEHLERVVYDELEYPHIVGARQKDFKKRDYERRGIKVLREPQPATMDLTFDKEFYDDMERGEVTHTFRRTQHGNVGDRFCVNGVYYKIRDIEMMTIRTFITLYWDKAGFNCQDDALEFFDNLYFPDWHDAWPPDYNGFYGYMHVFARCAE